MGRPAVKEFCYEDAQGEVVVPEDP